MKNNNQVLDLVSVVFLIIGGLNWGLIGLFEWNFIGSIFGCASVMTRIIYSIAGFSAVYRILCWSRTQK